MISTLKEVREALLYHVAQTRPIERTDQAITKLDALIAATEKTEPVGEVRAKSDAYGGTFVHWKKLPVAGMVLYPAPQSAAEPLTDEWIRERCDKTWVFDTVKQWVRAIEAAHGIGAKP